MKFKNIEKINQILNDPQIDIIYILTAKVNEVVNLQNITIFTVDDGETTIQLVKYSPGQPAYPELKKGYSATFSFKKSIHQNRVQGQIADITEITEPKEESNKSKANPIDPSLFSSKEWEKLNPMLEKIATKIKNAIETKTPIIISHHGDCDGYCGALLIEKPILKLLKERQPDLKFINNYYTRNASKTPYYDIGDATKDISSWKSNSSRTDNKDPLIIILDNGSTEEDILAIKKVQLFGAEVVVVDHHDPGTLDECNKSGVCNLVSEHANPYLVGLNKEFSTSMLALKLAHLISPKIAHDIFTATLGGVADKCKGDAIEEFIKQSGKSKDYFRKLGKLVSLEIFFTKYAYGELPLFHLLSSDSNKRDELMQLSQTQLDLWDSEIKTMLAHYAIDTEWGKFAITVIDGEKLTLWNDYFSIGKLTSISHGIKEDTFPERKQITLTTSDSMIVYRVNQNEKLFDGNKLVSFLKEKLPHARISGGGHDVAGSIKFVPASKQQILEQIKDFISFL
jgi:archaea-specific RecJ-like exonuclease